MKWFLVLVIVALSAFLVHRYWAVIAPNVEPVVQPIVSSIPETPDLEYVPPAYAPGVTQLPRTGRVAPPGSVYMLERVSKQTDNGVVAVVPGEEVRIMQKRDGGNLRVTTGKHDFDVKASQVTKDYDTAQEARVREAALAP